MGIHEQRGADPAVRELRTDAKRNRARLLAAADAVFRERGADASMNDVAKRCGVGIGTLYRHFPTREALLAAACDDRLLALALEERSREAATVDALAEHLVALALHACIYRGLAASFGVVLKNGSPGCHAATAAASELLARVKASGAVRRDVELDDVICVATAVSLAVQDDPSDTKRVRRLVSMFVDGLRVGPHVRSTRSPAPRSSRAGSAKPRTRTAGRTPR